MQLIPFLPIFIDTVLTIVLEVSGFYVSLTAFSYIIEGHVCYLTMCDRAYPKKLAFQYLEDLKNEFERVNGAHIETAARPYAFIKFGAR